MKIDILAVGDEVLYGYSINSNASFISQQLLEHGFLPTMHTVVADSSVDVRDVLVGALGQGHVVIMTGGLGPTIDDLTRKIVADIFGLPLVKHESLRAKLEHMSCAPSAIKDQLMQPHGAVLLENDIGTASGIILEDQQRFPGALLIAMPGVPTEMKDMFVRQALPYLVERYKAQKRLFVKTLHFAGLIENQLDPLLRNVKEHYPNIACGIYPSFATVAVQLRGYDEQQLEVAAKPFLDAFDKNIYFSHSGTIVEAVHQKLMQSDLTVATAESCTGGALAAAFVTNPDASHYFLGSIVAYANSVKQNLLGVDSHLVEQYGAVSEEVTAQMALGACQKLGATLGISVSGILGPTGSTPAKPVGTVCASIAYGGKVVLSWTMHLKGTRQHLIQKVVEQIFAKIYLLNL